MHGIYTGSKYVGLLSWLSLAWQLVLVLLTGDRFVVECVGG